jgi:hypothetical protein
MKPETRAVAILLSWIASAVAQGTSTPTPATRATVATPVPTPQTEVEKWIAQVDESQQQEFRKQVTAPFEASVADLGKRYLASVDAALGKASSAGHLDEAIAWRNERIAFEHAQNVVADADDTPAGIKILRAGFRQQLLKLDRDRLAQSKVMFFQHERLP